MKRRNAGAKTDAPAFTDPRLLIARLRAPLQHSVDNLRSRERTAVACKLTHVATRAYWREVQQSYVDPWPLPSLFVPIVSVRLSRGQRADATRLGMAAAALDVVNAGYFIATTYAALLPPKIRSAFGIYYTPPALTSRLLDQATSAGVEWSTCKAVDPACGGGAFLAPLAQRLTKQLSHLEPGAIVESLTHRLEGFERDPFSAWLSQVFVEVAVIGECRAAGRRLPRLVHVGDTLALADAHDAQYDLVVGNPPYGRVKLSKRAARTFRRSLYGHANLYALFTDLALRWTRPGGVFAYVTPTSFLAGQYFRRLRGLLAEHAPPSGIDLIASRKGVFDDVLQEALLAAYRVGATGTAAPITVLMLDDESTFRLEPAGHFMLRATREAPWLLPRSGADATLVSYLQHLPTNLAHWGYKVSTGPLVWNRHKRQLRRRYRAGCLPLIWAEAVTSDGRFVFQAQRRNHKPYFCLSGPADEWLVARASCVLLQRTTAKEQARRLIAAEMPEQLLMEFGGAVVENHVNMLRPTTVIPPVAPRTLAAFLNSEAADLAFRCISGSVAVSAYELERLPLPPAESLGRLHDLVVQGRSRVEVERECWSLYGRDFDGRN